MTPGRTPFGSIIRINALCLQAFVLGLCALWIWPSSLEWWGFGLLSIVLGLAAVVKCAEVLRAMAKIYLREKAIARIVASSRAPDPSDLADQDALRNAGMIDD